MKVSETERPRSGEPTQIRVSRREEAFYIIKAEPASIAFDVPMDQLS